MKLTFIGNGNMAQAILNGLASSNYEIELVGRDLEKLKVIQIKLPKIQITQLTDNFDITDKNIIFCVKPYNLIEVGTKLKGIANSFYSILAGTKIDTIKQHIRAKNYVRTMPNVAAKFNKSMTTLTGDVNAKNDAIDIFKFIGSTLWLDSENEIDIATAVAGSGPAFLAYFADGIIQGGINAGLKDEDALRLTQGLFDGFVPLLNDDNPKEIIRKVMSPNGTTQAGYEYLVANDVNNYISNTIQTAYNRALELAKS